MDIVDFTTEHFRALRGRVRGDFYERNSPYMDRCEGLTILDGDTVLGCWGLIGDEPWVAIATDLSLGRLRFVIETMREWRDTQEWITHAHLQMDDTQATRFARFMGFCEDERLPGGIVRYRYERRAPAW